MASFTNIFILAFICLVLDVEAQGPRLVANIQTNNGSDKVFAFEGETANFTASITYSLISGSQNDQDTFVKCWMDYLKVGEMVNWTDIYLPRTTFENSSISLNIALYAKRLGGSNVVCSILSGANSTKLYEGIIAKFIVSRHITVPEVIFRIIVMIAIIFLTFVMGCGLDRHIILAYFKKPISPLIGFCSQFIFMPLISAALGKFTGIDKAFGLGLLVIGCSPGGGASNIWTVLFRGDLDLSMTMTFVSSCAALAMMPMWLFLLGRFFIDPKLVKIPFGNIAINLLQVVIPAGLGLLFRYKWESKSKILLKKVKLLALIFIIFIFTYGTYANLYIYKLIGDYIYLLPIGAFLPWLGFLFGFIFAIITKRSKTQSIAIALETGFQNIGIAILILKYSMDQPDGDLGSVMPMVVAIFTPMPLYFGYIVVMIKRKCFDKQKKKAETEMKSLDNDQQNALLKVNDSTNTNN